MNLLLVLFLLINVHFGTLSPISYLSCQPVGPYPYQLAVIPSATEHYILISASIHVPDSTDRKSPTSSMRCNGKINSDVLFMVEALFYAKDTYVTRLASQARSEPLGLIILDNCGDNEKTIQDFINFESCTLAFASRASFGGPTIFPEDALLYFIIDYKSDTSVNELEKKFSSSNLRRKPMIRMSEYEEVSEKMIRSMALVLNRLLYKNIAVVISDNVIGRYRLSAFRNATDSMEICVQIHKLAPDSDDAKAADLLRFIADDKNIRVLVILTDSVQTPLIFDGAKKADLLRRWHWLGFCASLKSLQELDESAMAPGSIMLARENDLTDFYEYINAEKDLSNAPWASARNPWLREYFSPTKCNGTSCDQRSNSKFQENHWLQYNDAIADIVSAYDAASMAWASQGDLESIARPAMRSPLASIMILNYRHTSKGWRFVRIGTVEEGGLRLQASSVQTYMQRPIDNRDSCPSTCRYCESIKHRSIDSLNRSAASAAERTNKFDSTNEADFMHRSELWACLLTGFASSMTFMILIYEGYALSKICHRLSRVNAIAQSGIFLSQGLLYGVFLQSISVFTITVAPNFYVCAVQRFLPGIGCVLSYSILFAKLLVLISARQGQYLASCYQALVVVLFLAMQTIVSIHWLAARPIDEYRLGAGLEDASTNQTDGLFVVSLWNYGKYEHGCNSSFIEYFKMLILPVCLIFLCLVTATLTRKNPHNHKETLFIALASLSSGVIWGVWTFLGIYFKKEGLQDAILGYGLLTSAFVLTAIMFLPSSRQKTTMGHGVGLNPGDILGVKSNVPSGPTWVQYFEGHQKPPSLVPTQTIRKNATVHNSKRSHHKRRPSKDESETRPIHHSLSLQKATAGVNRHLDGARSIAPDPVGSAITLDAGSMRIIPTPPPPPPMTFFNSRWKPQIPTRTSSAQRVESTAGHQQANSQEPNQDVMIYSSFGNDSPKEKSSTTPKPVFPVLTPAQLLTDISSRENIDLNRKCIKAEITYAHVCKHSICSKPHLPRKPVLRYPTSCLYRSRSSQDFRQCRKRGVLCLHSNLYRSRSFSDIKEMSQIGEHGNEENEEKKSALT